MKISDLITNDFHVIDTGLTCKDAVNILSELDSGYVILNRKAHGARANSYYLFDRKNFLNTLRHLQVEHVYDMPNLSRCQVVPTFTADVKWIGGTSRGVVFEEGKPVRVFDISKFGGDFSELKVGKSRKLAATIKDSKSRRLVVTIKADKSRKLVVAIKAGKSRKLAATIKDSKSRGATRSIKASKSRVSTRSTTVSESRGLAEINKAGKSSKLTTSIKADKSSKLNACFKTQISSKLVGDLKGERKEKVTSKSIIEKDTKRVTRQLVGDLDSEVKLHSRILLKVTLTSATISGPNVASVFAEVGSKIDIIVNPVDLLSLSTKNSATASLEVQEPQSDQTIEFELVANGVGVGRVEVCAFHCGANIATLELTTKIVEDTFDAGHAHGRKTENIELSQRKQPDVSLYIFENDKKLQFYLNSADGKYQMVEYGPIELHSPREYFQNYFRDIENHPLETTANRKDAMEQISTQGLDLFSKAVPEDLQEVLWKLQDRVKTFQVMSDEPWIPWEVCKLKGRINNGQIVEGPFFAEAFNITRWFRQVPAITRLTISNMALIVPEDSGLENAEKEKVFVFSLKAASRDISDINPTLSDVKIAMSKGVFDAWHFAGHANAAVTLDADQSAIELLGRKKLTPSQIVGNAENMLGANPLVFFNACQSARSGLSLSGGGGWAQRLIKVKRDYPSASAFIGTYWSVGDDKACSFAIEFYTQLLKDGKTIGEAAKNARLKIKSDNDPAWLAYTVYADPYAKVG